MKLNSWMLCVAMSLLACSSVQAQQPGGGRPGGGRGGGSFGGGFGGGGQQSLISLANNEAVQKELAVEDIAKTLLKEINDEYRAEIQKAMGDGGGFANFRDMSEEERQKATEKMAASRKAVTDKFLPDLKGTLTTAQFKRLQEISWQAARSQVWSDAEFVKALGLKKDQQDKIAAIIKEYGEKQRGLFSGGGAGGEGGRPDFQAMRTKMDEMSKERDEKINEVLTKDQQAKAKSLKGKEFDVAQLQPRGFGGPGGGGTGGAGGRPGGGQGGRPEGNAGRPKRPEPKAE